MFELIKIYASPRSGEIGICQGVTFLVPRSSYKKPVHCASFTSQDFPAVPSVPSTVPRGVSQPSHATISVGRWDGRPGRDGHRVGEASMKDFTRLKIKFAREA
jgi:hypothetical protein